MIKTSTTVFKSNYYIILHHIAKFIPLTGADKSTQPDQQIDALVNYKLLTQHTQHFYSQSKTQYLCIIIKADTIFSLEGVEHCIGTYQSCKPGSRISQKFCISHWSPLEWKNYWYTLLEFLNFSPCILIWRGKQVSWRKRITEPFFFFNENLNFFCMYEFQNLDSHNTSYIKTLRISFSPWSKPLQGNMNDNKFYTRPKQIL